MEFNEIELELMRDAVFIRHMPLLEDIEGGIVCFTWHTKMGNKS